MDNQAAATSPIAAGNTGAVSSPRSNIGVLDEFQNELIIAWRRLPNKGFFFTLLAAWLVLFQLRGNSLLGYVHSSSLFTWMYETYNSPNELASDDKIGNFIPFLVLGIFWWKRRELLALKLDLWLPGLFLVVLAMGLHVVGYGIQEPHLSIAALFVGIYGLMALAWGWRWMLNSFFPFFLFIFSVPLGNHTAFLTTRLQLLVSQLVEITAGWIGIHVIRDGNKLMNSAGDYAYEVAAACSGIRSLFTIFLLATVYGFLTFRSPGKRLLLISLAVPFSVLGNLMRMLCIILAAEVAGKKWGDIVHENWIISLVPYIPVIVGMLALGGWLEKLEKKKVTT
jgi:exosortase